MKIYQPLILLTLLGILAFSGCRSTRIATEVDDVYATSEDEVVVVEHTNLAARDAEYEQNIESYNNTYYEDDDFQFSRRLRRFHGNSRNDWRYYDPYYSNDLYYVMGTNSWDPWYNDFGWYNWNRPRFGVTMSYGWGYNNWYTGFNNFYNPYTYNPWFSYNAYNPFVSTYYGYNPWYGYGGINGWGNGYWNGYNQGFCDGLTAGAGSSASTWQSYRNVHRGSTSTIAAVGNGRPGIHPVGNPERNAVNVNNSNDNRTYIFDDSKPSQNVTVSRPSSNSNQNNQIYLTPKRDNEFPKPTQSSPMTRPSYDNNTNRPINDTYTRPQTSPSQTRPSTRPSQTRPSQERPSSRPSTRPSQSRPESRPSTRPSSRPSSRPNSVSPSRSSSPSPSRSSSPRPSSSPRGSSSRPR